VATAAVSSVIYLSLRESEQREFEQRFFDQSAHVVHAVHTNLNAKLSAIDALATTITSYAGSQLNGWPNITLPEFSYRATSALGIGKGLSIGMQPIVYKKNLKEWEEFSVHSQGWRKEGLDFQTTYARPSADSDGDDSNGGHDGHSGHDGHRSLNLGSGGPFTGVVQNISHHIFRVDGGIPETIENDFMLPVWQHHPVHEGLPWVNYDVNSKVDNKAALAEVLLNHHAVIGLFFELSESSHGHDFCPMDSLYGQLHWDDIWDHNPGAAHRSRNRDLQMDHTGHSGMDNSDMDHSGMDHSGMDDSDMDHSGMDHSGMDHSGTDHSGTGNSGMDNDHADHAHMEHFSGPAANIWYPVFSNFTDDRELVSVLSMTVPWISFFVGSLPPNPNGLIVVVKNSCDQVFTYDITGDEITYLGPADYHERDFTSYAVESKVYSVQTSFTQISLSTAYCPYRVTVYPSEKMRQSFETSRALVFTAGVVAIFLFTVLVFVFYDYLVGRRQKNLAEAAFKSDAIVSALFPKIVRDRLFDHSHALGNGPSAQKGLKQFLNQSSNLDQRGELQMKAPIADLFPHATVMFGDISGFTAWSSSRQPTEVFILLETLYGAFDKVARQMEVFKVETIGDCYVAVTGLPVAQEDHHLRMVRFARSCLDQMRGITREMEVSLGPDTSNLGFRIGLHSGSVTAGVLRGEKSRFQLFGDTVNTASRMESTGTPNAIQVSQATADLLVESGKTYWMKKREELVSAKGKGEVQTYWIRLRNRVASTSSSSREKDDGDGDSEERPQSMREKETEDRKCGIRKTLIEWQVELLSRLLKQIVVQRESKKTKVSHSELQNLDVIKTNPRDQITEKIIMPEFDHSKTKKKCSGVGSVELPPKVVQQLLDLVTTIAMLYHDNNFHNYEHACHVTMSANKLLSRIVVPKTAESLGVDSLELKAAHDFTYGLTSDPLTQFAIVFSAIVHDLDHHGVSNGQLAKEGNRLASVYHEKSIAEQNSIDLAFEILTSSSYSDLVCCICADATEYRRFRQLVVNCVMATDM